MDLKYFKSRYKPKSNFDMKKITGAKLSVYVNILIYQ